MSAPAQPSTEPITGKAQLVAYIAAGCKPPEKWRIGTEHEKFAYTTDDLRSLPYEGPRGIRAVLEAFTEFGWQPVLENGVPIALTQNDASITLEPGGQVELSGAPLESVHQTCIEVNKHLDQAKRIGEKLGIGFLGMGFTPQWRRDDIHWMPKGRYAIMRRYMPTKGKLGLDMMLRTCTVQVNLDFASEADMVKKFRTSLALQPIATALFADSPLIEGKANGFVSYRSHIWTDTDPDRCGTIPFVFEPGMGFERYVDWMLDVPMYFVYREGRYIDASGQSFRDFMAGKLPALPGELPTIGDWADHLTTAFPEVRLKKFLEMRGADGGPWRRLCALPAFWVGLLYDAAALDGAWEIAKDWTAADHDRMRAEVPRLGLKAMAGSRTVREIAIDLLALARAGLDRRYRLNARGRTEAIFLDDLDEIAQSGMTPAEAMLAEFNGRTEGNLAALYRDHSY
jgi:glutamate--cysteine ligase